VSFRLRCKEYLKTIFELKYRYLSAKITPITLIMLIIHWH